MQTEPWQIIIGTGHMTLIHFGILLPSVLSNIAITIQSTIIKKGYPPTKQADQINHRLWQPPKSIKPKKNEIAWSATVPTTPYTQLD